MLLLVNLTASSFGSSAMVIHVLNPAGCKDIYSKRLLLSSLTLQSNLAVMQRHLQEGLIKAVKERHLNPFSLILVSCVFLGIVNTQNEIEEKEL